MSHAEVVNPAGVGAIPVVLIVDDHAEVTRALGHLFTKSGFTPATFHSASEALDFVEEHTPAAAVIDILKQWGVSRMTFLGLIAAPEGVQALEQAHPDVSIYLGAIDSHLDADPRSVRPERLQLDAASDSAR